MAAHCWHDAPAQMSAPAPRDGGPGPWSPGAVSGGNITVTCCFCGARAWAQWEAVSARLLGHGPYYQPMQQQIVGYIGEDGAPAGPCAPAPAGEPAR